MTKRDFHDWFVETIPGLYLYHRGLGFGRWKALKRAIHVWR